MAVVGADLLLLTDMLVLLLDEALYLNVRLLEVDDEFALFLILVRQQVELAELAL